MQKAIKLLCIGMVIVMITSALVGCGNKTTTEVSTESTQQAVESQVPASTEPVKLVMYGGVPAESGPADMVEAFNKLNNGITVEYVRFVNDDSGNLKLDTSIMAGQGVDLFVTYTRDRLVSRVKNGSVLDLTELLAKYYPEYEQDVGVLASFTKVDGKVYAIETAQQPKAYTINKKMFDDAGIAVPTSWSVEEYREIAKKLTKGTGDDKVFGTFLFDGDWDKWIKPAVAKLGGDLLWKADGTSNLDAPEIKTALQLYYDMSLVDNSMPSLAETKTKKLQPQVMFLTGKAAMTDAQWIFRYIKDTATYPHDFVTAFAPYPTVDKNSPFICPGGQGDSVSIVAASKNTDAAMKFLAWYQKEGVLSMAKYGRIPASKSISKDTISKIMLGGVEKLFDKQSFEDYYLGGKVEQYGLQIQTTAAPELTKIVTEESEKVFTKNITVDEGITKMKSRGDEALKNAK